MLNIYSTNDPGSKLIINKLDELDIKCNHIKTKFDCINPDYQQLYNTILDSNIYNALFLGFDHSISIASISANLFKYPNLFVIWIDTNPNINENNIISILTGINKKFNWFNKYLNFDKLLYFGIKNLTDNEKIFFESNNIRYYTSDYINNNIENVIKEINFLINNNPTHISFNINVINSKYIDCNILNSENGIDLINVKYLFESLTNIVSLDIVEFNPLIGNPEKSINNLIDLITE